MSVTLSDRFCNTFHIGKVQRKPMRQEVTALRTRALKLPKSDAAQQVMTQLNTARDTIYGKARSNTERQTSVDTAQRICRTVLPDLEKLEAKKRQLEPATFKTKTATKEDQARAKLLLKTLDEVAKSIETSFVPTKGKPQVLMPEALSRFTLNGQAERIRLQITGSIVTEARNTELDGEIDDLRGTIKEAADYITEQQSCYRCHGLQHQGQGLVATAECNKCHPPGFKLMPDNHTTQFVAGGHKGRASSDPSYCAMCHKTQFCVECHSGRGTGPNAPKKPVVPEGHSDARWQARHGQLFLAKKGDCGACHDDASCKTCHKTVMPHPPQWIENHKPGPGVSPDDCNICHTNRSACQNCHHGALKSADLVEKNCVRCHAILKTKPATSIKNREMVEHAVHFEVPKYKGKAYKCYECHSDFGTNTSSSKSSLRQGHDVRLCYSCHGALDPVTHEKVALYPGAELCRRCHSNLNF